MRLIFTLITLLTFGNLFSQSAVLSNRLMEAINSQPSQKHSVYFLLQDRVDAYGLQLEMERQQLPQQQRVERLITALKQKADETQPAIIQALSQQYGVTQESIRAYWISNMVFAYADSEAILDLANRQDIDFIDLSVDLALTEFVDEDVEVNLEPSGTEPGLLAIGADFMWAMGYTGYGQKALVIDTGTEPSHPSLKMKFLANNVPVEEAWYDASPTEPYDCNNHGTHVAGTIVGLDRLMDDTIGVAFNAQWMASPPIACYGDTEYFGTQRIIESFQWSLDPDGNASTSEDLPTIINNSWYDPRIDTLECVSAYVDVFNALEAAGVAVIFSAGNEGPADQTVTPPHNINTDLVNSFTVGALDGDSPALSIANFSSRGPSLCGGTGSLAIKPEVSAPGVFVRSAIRNGGYDNFSGTSMASPHTSGAVLLLKEAFPDLLGRELKEALYFSAIDLGDPGEDNTYGMGIINLPAAYQYLLDQGHSPVSPLVDVDAMLMSTEIESFACFGATEATVWIENGGQTDLQTVNVEMTITDQQGSTQSIQGTTQNILATAERESITLPINNLEPGIYEVEVRITGINGQTDERLLNNQYRQTIQRVNAEPIEILDEFDGDLCEGSEIILLTSFEGTGKTRWFKEGQALPIAQDPQILVPAEDGAIYRAEVIEERNAGMAVEEVSAWLSHPVDTFGGLLFDAISPFKLVSVQIEAIETGGTIIELRDFRNELITSKTVIISSTGSQMINLNFQVPVGNNHSLTIADGKVFSISEALDVADVDGVLRMKGATVDFGLAADEYHYFYDWVIEYDYLCGDASIELALDPDRTAPSAIFTASQDTIDLAVSNQIVFTLDDLTDIQSVEWDFGNGTGSTLLEPTAVFVDPGIYEVIVEVVGVNGCTSAYMISIFVETSVSTADLDAGLDLDLQIYPNPTVQDIQLTWKNQSSKPVNIQVFDLQGRPLVTQQTFGGQTRIDLKHLPSGIYLIQVQTDRATQTKRVVRW